MKRTHSKNSIFLMEIILNVLLFCFFLVIGLQFFLRTHTITKETQELHQAVTSCENAASAFESGDGTLSPLLDTYRYRVNLGNQVLIYLNSDFNECKKSQASYYIRANYTPDSNDTLSKAEFTCYTISEAQLYTLTACNYRQLHAPLKGFRSKEVFE